MRKCPSCGKGVPVGAKRCIYCHASVKVVAGKGGGEGIRITGADPSHTLLGIPGTSPAAKKPEDPQAIKRPDASAVGGATSFGVGTRSRGTPLGARAPLGGRRPEGKGVRQTLMGLGSVKVLNEPGGEKPPAPSAPQANLRSTMAGMPGISINKPTDRPKTTPANQVLSRGTMMGMPAISTARLNEPSKSSTEQATVAISNDHVQRAKLLAQSINAQRNADAALQLNMPPTARAVAAPAVAAPAVAAPAVTAPAVAAPAVAAPAVAAPAPAQHKPVPIPEPEEEEFDPLAGMIGVHEPKVSSLMDEEVENLSAQVFGAEFSFSEEEFDDDDEDDFDDFTFGGGGGSGSTEQASKKPSAAPSNTPPPEEDEDDVHHDIAAAEAALANMMMDLEDVMPTEDEAAAALGLDEAKVAAAHAAAEAEEAEEDEPFAPETNDDDGPTIADADVSSLLAQIKDKPTKAPTFAAMDDLPPARTAETSLREEPAPVPEPKPKKKKAPAASSLGVGFGPGGIVAAVGALATVAWMFVPGTEGSMAISGFLALDVGSKVLGVFSFVAAVLAVVTSMMRLPAFSKMLILVVLGLGLGVLSTSAKVMSQSPANFIVYGAAGLFVIAAVVYKLTTPKK